jgi:DNA-binding transcriptional regulator YhcF (GntR family)
MLFRVDPDSPLGLAEQVAAQVRSAVADGSLRPGEKLPAARELASGLDINMHTVLRAYADLRDEGLIDLRRGRGAHVVAAPETPWAARLEQQVRDLVDTATRMGLSTDELVERIRRATT